MGEIPAVPIALHVTAAFRVTYADTDRMNHAYHANYLVWFEVGRVELLRSLGQRYRDWEDKQGIFLPVRRCNVEYLQAALYDDLLVVETTITKISRATIHFAYRLLRSGENVVLAVAETHHVFMSDGGKILRVADKLLPQFFGG